MYVRVNVVEFKSKVAMEEALSIYRLKSAEWMVGAQFLLTMKTSDQSAMYVAVYNSENDADNALVGREKYIEAIGDFVHDIFYHEGDMDFAYLNENFLKAEMVQIGSNSKR